MQGFPGDHHKIRPVRVGAGFLLEETGIEPSDRP